jgi:hypothetical protein
MSDYDNIKGESIPSLSSFSLDVEEINFVCQTWKIPKTHKLGGLIVFKGFYPRGAAGVKHAHYIQASVQTFCTMARIVALIVDFRELDYVWGDDLSVLPKNNVRIRRILIPSESTKPDQYAGFVSMLGKEYLVTEIRAAFRDIRLFFQN